MPPALLIEEFHISVTVPPRLRQMEYAAIRGTLNGVRFRGELRRAIRDLQRCYPSLAKATLKLST